MSKELKSYNPPAGGDALQLPTSYQPVASPDPVVLLRRYLAFLSRKWWIVLISVLCFGTLATAYVIWWPESYATTAHIWAAGKMGLQLREGSTYTEDNLTYAGTQAQLLQSDSILGRAYDRVTNSLHVVVPLDSEGRPKLPTIKVSQMPKSAVLELKAKSFSPEVTVAFLDAVMDEFIAYKREIRATSSGDTYSSVSEQIKKQEAELTAAQDELTTYMLENNVALLRERANAASIYLTQLLATSSDLKVQLQVIQSLLDLGAAGGTNALASSVKIDQLNSALLPASGIPPELLTAEQDLEKLRILRARLSLYLRPEHLKIVKLDEQIAEGTRLVEFVSGQSRDQLGNTAQTIKTKLDRLAESIKEWEGKVNDASERIAECELLKLNVGRMQELHDHLLSLLQTVDVSKNLDQENITILDHPSLPKSAKHTLLVAAFLIFVGLGTGLGVVFLLQQLDNRVNSLDELTERFDEWIVGQVPEMPGTKSPKLLAAGGAGPAGGQK